MNKKILVSIKIPLIEQELDLLIPKNKKVGNIKKEVVKLINEIYPNLIEPNQNISFYEQTTGTILRNDQYVKKNIKNGSYLILI